MQLWR